MLLIHHKNPTQASSNPQLAVGIFEHIVRPVGVVCPGFVYNVIMHKLAACVVIPIDASVGGYPELVFSVFVNVADAVVRQRISFVSHFIPDGIVLVSLRADEANQAVGPPEPIQPFGIAKQRIELVAVARSGDLGNRNMLQGTVVARK